MDPTPSNPIDGYKERIMAKFTAAQIEEHAAKIMEAFEDGFQWADVFDIVPQAMEIVEAVGGMSGPEKEESALAIIDYVIDNTDTPWIPDNMTDPLLKKGARYMIPMILKAAKGDLKVDSLKEAEEDSSA
jgi:hypothetical protein